MDERSFEISAAIGALISQGAPKTDISESAVAKAKSEFSEAELRELSSLGLIKNGDFLQFYVMREFCSSISLGDIASGEYIAKLFSRSRHLDADEFESDPYIKNVAFADRQIGNIRLCRASYDAGEMFQYDMPDLSEDTVVPKIGFFDRKVSFPALYEGNIPWVSVCPSEINSMKEQIGKAFGNVLVFGLGLGYYPYMISKKPDVKSIVIVEISKKITDIFNDNILPFFENRNKIKVVCADATEYIKSVKDGDFDFLFADIWEGAVDGAPLYEKIKAHEKRLLSTEFTYWIEDEIKSYLSEA